MKQNNISIISRKQKGTPALEPKSDMSDKIAVQVEAFLAGGNQITSVDMGVSGQAKASKPYKMWAQMQNYRTQVKAGR